MHNAESRRVFVTGLTGFTGVYLRERLESAGHVVGGIGNETATQTGVVKCDLLDTEGLSRAIGEFRPDWVVHLAAIAFVGHGAPQEFYRVNVVGTESLLQAIASAGVMPDKVLIASSANVYGNARTLPITEDTVPAPTNHYANSKLAMEMICRNWFDRFPIVIARPFNYTGWGQPEHFLVPKVVAHLARGASTIKLGNLDVARDISDVSYLVDAYARLLESDVQGVPVNICSGKPYTLREIVAAAESAAGATIRIEVDSQLVRSGEVNVLFGSPARLYEHVGVMTPIPIDQIVDNREYQ